MDKASFLAVLKDSVNKTYKEELKEKNIAFKKYRELKDILKKSKNKDDKYTASFHNSEVRKSFLELLDNMYVASTAERDAVCEAKNQLVYGLDIAEKGKVEDYTKNLISGVVESVPYAKIVTGTISSVVGTEKLDNLTSSAAKTLTRTVVNSVDKVITYFRGTSYKNNVQDPLEEFVNKNIWEKKKNTDIKDNRSREIFNNWLMNECKKLQDKTKQYITYRNKLLEEAGIKPSIECSVFLRVLYSIAGIKVANSESGQGPGGLLYKLTLNTCLDEPKNPKLSKGYENLNILEDYVAK